MNLIVGEKVPVTLQVTDGNTGLFPQAFVRDNDDNLLTTLDLSHSNNGEYVPAIDYVMPDRDFIKVQYKAFTDAGHTTPAAYELDIDVFQKELVHERTWDENINNHLIADSTGAVLNLLTGLDINTILARILESDVTVSVDAEPEIVVTVESEPEIFAQITED